jgi:bacterial/archaeal transporter family-2 protein
MDNLLWVALAALAGASIPFNAAFNARLGVAGSSPIHASMISFGIGTLTIALYAVATRQTVSWTGFFAAPWYAWLGGICGAFSLTAIILTYPKLGPGLGFGLVVAGQLVVSVLLEHFGVLVAQPHPISVLRVVGLGLVFGGVALIRMF